MFPTKNKSINRWAAFMVFAFMLLFLVVFGRFVYIAEAKKIDAHDLLALGKKNWQNVKVIDSKRGTIFDSRGKVLASDVPAFTIYAVLSKNASDHVQDPVKTAEKLSPILGIPQDTIMQYLNKKNLYQVEFGTKGKRLSSDTKQKIDALHLPGIHFITDSKRYYPNQSFASYVIGFTHYDENKGKQVGELGIEKELNKELTEQDGTVSFYSDKQGLEMPDAKEKVKPPHDGDNVYLTLDYRIQTVLDDAMEKVSKEYKPKKMMGIVADPKTGKILAMSNYPTFNPNTRDISNYTNFSISAPFEPGSTMKMFTLSAAVNEGVWPGDKKYQSGHYHVGGITIHDYNQSWGKISFNEGLERSSNVAFSILADKILGTDRLFKYIDAFGLNKKTGIDLPHESSSLLATRYHADEVSTAFGQGSAFTAIQLVQAATAIANDGKMMKPYVINKVVDPKTGKVVLKHSPHVSGTPITKKTATKVRELLRTVVDGKYGTGKIFNIKGYNVVGKTGTAQIPDRKHPENGYLKGKYVHSFLGMAPEDNPKLVVYVAIDRPNLKKYESGNVPVSEIFNPVMSNGLEYMNITPNESTTKQTTKTVKLDKNYTNQPLQETASQLKKKGLDVIALGHGHVTKQLPYAHTQLLKGSKVILLGEGPYQMPDIHGWSLADSLKLADLLDIKPNILGKGYVIKQKPQSGDPIKKGDYLYFELSDPSNPKQKTEKNQKQSNKPAN